MVGAVTRMVRCPPVQRPLWSRVRLRLLRLGRDFGQNLQTTAVEFVVNSQGQVLLVTSDDQGGLHFFSYAPNSNNDLI